MSAFLDWQVDFLLWLEMFRTPFFDQLNLLLTRLGEEELIILIIGWLYWNWNKSKTVTATYAFSLVLLLSIGLKDVFDIPRPFNYSSELTTAKEIYTQETMELGFAFPSGHSAIAAGWTSLVATLFNKKWIWISAFIIMILVGFSRMYIGVHYPLDVIFGLSIGVLVTIYGQKLYHKLPSNLWKYITPIIIIAPFFFFGLHEDFYKTLGLYIGFVGGVLLEQKFDLLKQTSLPILKQIFRFIIGVIVVLLFQQGLKLVFPEGVILFETIRYIMVGFGLFGIAPFLFTRLKLS